MARAPANQEITPELLAAVRASVATHTQKTQSAGGDNTGGLVVAQLDRVVQYYKLTTSDVILIGTFGGLGSLFLAVSGTAFGYYLDLNTTAAFATDPLSVRAAFLRDTVTPIAGWVCIISAAIGVGFIGAGGWRFKTIKDDHKERTGRATI